MRIWPLLLTLLFASSVSADCSCAAPQFTCDLIQDLHTVSEIDRCLCERFPVTVNHFGFPGLIVTPSARMFDNGMVSIGYSHHPPYRNTNMLVQPLERLELSLNYRIFKDMDDVILTPMGFGDFSDKGANWKFAITLPEHSDYKLPGIAVGMEDFIGTRGFKSIYAVATQVLPQLNAELTLGWGQDRLGGFFGGVNFMPFRTSCYPYLQGLTLTGEYDPINYEDPHIEHHPDGRTRSSMYNWGAKYRLCDLMDFSVAYIRGEEWAWSTSVFYNFGDFKGFLPKTEDALRYRAPINVEPIGVRRPESVMAQDLVYAFREQGFNVLEVDLEYGDCGERQLWLRISNDRYRYEECIRLRLYSLVSRLTPSDIDCVTVNLEASGMGVQAYHFRREFLERYRHCQLSDCELAILSPMTEEACPGCNAYPVFYQCRPGFSWSLAPRWRTFFGSASGKFKYSLGPTLGLRGTLWDYLDYKIQVTHDALSNLKDCRDVDALNPSQIPNVRSDVVGYYQNDEPYVEELYIQRNWSCANGVYGRLAAGYFELMYGGVAAELLYYPVCTDWAVGAELGLFQKRERSGLGFLDKIRQLDRYQPTYVEHFPWQGLVYFYYDCKALEMDFKITAGSFLAHDVGARFEVSRYFANGLRLSLWYTYTDANDVLNGARYYDKGVSFTMPLDFFRRCSTKDYWGYGMSAWLRDVGQQARSGDRLLPILQAERY